MMHVELQSILIPQAFELYQAFKLQQAFEMLGGLSYS